MHLPPRPAISAVFAWLTLIVFSYTIYHFIWYLPAWLQYRTAAEIAAQAAYVGALALLESAALLCGLLLVAAVLPARLLRARFAAQGTLMVWILSLWAALLLYVINNHLEALNNFQRQFTGGEMVFSLLLLALIGLSLILAPYLLTRRFPALEAQLLSLGRRTGVFLYLYVPLGLLGWLVVLFRNR